MGNDEDVTILYCLKCEAENKFPTAQTKGMTAMLKCSSCGTSARKTAYRKPDWTVETGVKHDNTEGKPVFGYVAKQVDE